MCLTEYIPALFVHSRVAVESNSYQLIFEARLKPNTRTGLPVYNRVHHMGTVCSAVFVWDRLFRLRPQTQPIYSFHFGVPIWPLFLWWFPISLYYNYALFCKCWELPILASGMFTSDRVFPGLPVSPVLYRTENCN